MEINELLPVGSVVRLKNVEKRLMIYGIKQSAETEGAEKDTDYIGVPYPEGYMGTQYQYMFDHDGIEEVVWRGFEDMERDAFIENLSEIFAKQKQA